MVPHLVSFEAFSSAMIQGGITASSTYLWVSRYRCGPYPQYGWDFPEEIPEKFRKDLSERFLEFPSRVRLGYPKPYNSRHLRLPERFQNSLPPSMAGDASFFRIGSGEGLSELVMEFPAVLGAFLRVGIASSMSQIIAPL